MKWNLDKYISEFYKSKYKYLLDKLKKRYGYENSEDILQETIIKFSRYYNCDKGEPDAYLQKVLRSQIQDHLRRATKSLEFEMSDIDIESIEDKGTSVEELAEIEIILNECSELFRDSLSLTYKEISCKYNKSVGVVKTQIFNERKKIKEKW